MTIGRSFLSKIAIVKAATWGTAVDCDVANRGLGILEEGLAVDVGLLPDESVTGTADRKSGVTGEINVAGPITTELTYSNPVISTLIAMCMGRADTPVAPPGSVGANKPYAYYGSFRKGDTLEGYFVTMAFDKKQDGTAIHEIDSVKMNGFTISGGTGERTNVAFDTVGRKEGDFGSTTTTTLSSATIATPRRLVRFEDFKFLINRTTEDGALDTTHGFYPSNFTLTFANNTTGDHTSENAPYIDEPIRDNAIEVTGTFTIPKYTDETIETRMKAGTEMKMSIRAISTIQIPAAGGGPYYYAFEMFLPTVQITEASRPINRSSKIPANFSWVASETSGSAPDGMDGNGNLDTRTNTESKGSITESLRIEVTNVEQANPLA